jgi:hypothetical protein
MQDEIFRQNLIAVQFEVFLGETGPAIDRAGEAGAQDIQPLA